MSKRIHLSRVLAALPFVASAPLLAAESTYEALMQQPAPAQSSATSDKAFNPAISLILSGQFASYGNELDESEWAGFQLGGEAGEREPGFSLRESELNLQANVDDKFFGQSTIAFGSEGVEVEEAFLQTLALPDGLKVKAGKFFSGIGYLNRAHPHADEFVDNPLVYDAFLGGRYSDAGVQLSWLAPTATYLDAGVELMAGDEFPSAGRENDGKGAWTAFVNLGGDVGYSHSWLAGLSYLSTDVAERPSNGEGEGPVFTGSSDLWIADIVWKWAPNGNPREKNLKLQAEYFSRSEDGEFVDTIGAPGSYAGDQDGWYAQAIYQFAQQWRAGLRYDRLDSDNRIAGLTGTALDANGFAPKRASALLEYANSEFSSVRLQYSRDETAQESEGQVFLQYVMVMGAHGAHAF